MAEQTKKEYQKRLEKLNWLIKKEFMPSELKEMTGLSRRQVAEWDKRGILLSKQRKSSETWSWHKFTGANVIQLAILAGLRKAGLSPVDLRELAKWLRDREPKMMNDIKEKIARGANVFLSTNLYEFTLNSDADKEIEEALMLAYKKFREEKIVLQININSVIDSILKLLDKKPLKTKLKITEN